MEGSLLLADIADIFNHRGYDYAKIQIKTFTSVITARADMPAQPMN